MYEDQMLYARVLLHSSAFVSERCWDRYRQHDDSLCRVADRTGVADRSRQEFLEWLGRLLREEGVDHAGLGTALQREAWLHRVRAWMPQRHHRRLRWLKKWALRVREALRRR